MGAWRMGSAWGGEAPRWAGTVCTYARMQGGRRLVQAASLGASVQRARPFGESSWGRVKCHGRRRWRRAAEKLSSLGQHDTVRLDGEPNQSLPWKKAWPDRTLRPFSMAARDRVWDLTDSGNR